MVEMLSSLNIARNRRVLKSRILSKFVFLVKTARFPGKGTTTGPPANTHLCGAVNRSSSVRLASASSRQEPHISGDGCRELHTAGRSGAPKIRQRNSESRFTHETPAGFPAGIPGIGDEIEGAMQQAPHPGRQIELFFTASLRE